MAAGMQRVQSNVRMEWYLDARFGLFLHWGPYSVAGVEASWPIMAPRLSEAMFGTTVPITEKEYRSLPDRFNPADFDPDEWVRIAQDAGMRYIVFTAKHHDGFCMFDAPGTDYKITGTPYGRDICLALANACAKAGMRLGFYYSPPDMHHPGYRDTGKPATKNWLGEAHRPQWKSYLDYMESHVRKLLSDYGEVSILWFDALVNHIKYDPQRFHHLIHELSPNTLINDRLGDGYDFITPEQFIPKKGVPVRTGKPPATNESGEGLFRTVQFLLKIPGIRGFLRSQLKKYARGDLELTQVEQETFPAIGAFQPWETCMTMGQSWAYNPHETCWKSPHKLLRSLVEVVSRGGNYLLNVGPTEKGVFPPQAIERLQYIGRWMDTYEDSVRGTTFTPLHNLAFGSATQKRNRLFLHILDRPEDGRIEISDFPWKTSAVRSFSGDALPFRQVDDTLMVDLPGQPTDDVQVLIVNR